MPFSVTILGNRDEDMTVAIKLSYRILPEYNRM